MQTVSFVCLFITANCWLLVTAENSSNQDFGKWISICGNKIGKCHKLPYYIKHAVKKNISVVTEVEFSNSFHCLCALDLQKQLGVLNFTFLVKAFMLLLNCTQFIHWMQMDIICLLMWWSLNQLWNSSLGWGLQFTVCFINQCIYHGIIRFCGSSVFMEFMGTSYPWIEIIHELIK